MYETCVSYALYPLYDIFYNFIVSMCIFSEGAVKNPPTRILDKTSMNMAPQAVLSGCLIYFYVCCKQTLKSRSTDKAPNVFAIPRRKVAFDSYQIVLY